MGTRQDELTESPLVRLRVHWLVAAAVAAAGLTAILPLHIRHRHLSDVPLLPAGLQTVRLSHIASLSIGFLLLYVSTQLLGRKQLAYRITLVSLLTLTFISGLHVHTPWRTALYGLCCLLLVLSADVFTVRSDNYSLRRGAIAAAVVSLGALLYGTAGFYLLERRDFGIDFSLWQSLKYAALQLVTFQNEVLLPRTFTGRLFLQSLDAVSLLDLGLVVGSLFKPVRFALGGSDAERAEAETVIRRHSSSVEDFFKLWPADKHYFFNESRTAVLAYKVSGSSALVLDGPAGEPRAYGRLLRSFIAFAERNGWQAAIIHGDDSLDSWTGPLGMKRVFIGSEAVVDVAAFAGKTQRSKHFRYVTNKAEREGLRFELWSAPLTNDQISRLRAVSRDWVGRAGRREYTFIMGYFDSRYLRQCDVATLQQAGRTVAYCNLIPTYLPKERSIDHMRHMADMPGIGMHYLLKELLLYLEGKGVCRFNLGLSPLSGIEERLDRSLPERILASVKAIGSRYYAFRGLEQFKNKFEPVWQPRYIYYKGPVTSLLTIAANLNKAVAVPLRLRRKVVVVLTLSLLAGLSYVSFPLANLLGLLHDGLVSELGAQGAPYAWLFNGLDVVGGCLMMALAWLMLRNRVHSGRRLMALSGLFALCGLGAILAALTPLPAGVQLHDLWEIVEDPVVMLHVVFSAANVVALYLAATLLTVSKWHHSQLSRTGRKRLSVLYLALLLTGLANVPLETTPYGGLVQRLHICFIGLWIILIGLQALPRRRP